MDDSRSLSERIAFTPALGIALSDNVNTPNLLFTSKEKENEERVKRINRAIFAGIIVVFLICSGVFFTRMYSIEKKKTAIAGLEKELAQMGAPVDRNVLTKMVGQVNERKALSKVYAERYLGMVIIGEITAVTPENVRLLDMKASLSFTQSSVPEKTQGQNPKARVEEMTLDGIILNEREKLEASLASYVMTLEASPLFSQVTISKNTVEPYLKGEALHFTLNLKVEEHIHG